MNFTIAQIEEAVTALQTRDVEGFAYQTTRYGRMQKDGVSNTIEGRLVWDLVQEYGQRMNGIDHHLGWARAWFKKDAAPEGIQIEVNQAWISLIQAQMLAAQIEVSAGVAGLTKD